jgi:hypothetical protein
VLLDLLLLALVSYAVAFYALDLPYWLRVVAGSFFSAVALGFPIVTFVRMRRSRRKR